MQCEAQFSIDMEEVGGSSNCIYLVRDGVLGEGLVGVAYPATGRTGTQLLFNPFPRDQYIYLSI